MLFRSVIGTRGLDLFTVAIPPALPIGLTIGIVFTADRLKKKKISCIAPSRVNLAGSVETFCYDKTGMDKNTKRRKRLLTMSKLGIRHRNGILLPSSPCSFLKLRHIHLLLKK